MSAKGMPRRRYQLGKERQGTGTLRHKTRMALKMTRMMVFLTLRRARNLFLAFEGYDRMLCGGEGVYFGSCKDRKTGVVG